MRRAPRLAGLSLVLLLTGCAAHPPYHAKLADLSGQCVQSVRQLTPMPLAPLVVEPKKDKPLPYLEFADVAQCMQTSAGRQAVALYELKDMESAYELHVSVMLSTGGTLAATVQLLDADRQPLRVYPFDRFVRRGSEYSLAIFPRPDDLGARFLLVQPDLTFDGKTDTRPSALSSPVPIAGPAGAVAFIPSGRETQLVNPLMQGGKLLVTLRNLSTSPL